MKAVYSLERRKGQHAAVVEYLVPHFAGDLFQPVELLIVNHQHLAASGTSIEQAVDVIFRAASQAAVDQPAGWRGNKVGLNLFRKGLGFHGVINFFPPI